MGVNANQIQINGRSDMLERATCICRAYLPGCWKTITSKDVVVSHVSGGLSNWLYHVKLRTSGPETTPKEVLLRLYGQTHGDYGIQNLVTESVIFALLSERRLGPKLYGIFQEGRIEEYIPARPLKLDEMADVKISLLIAEKMADIHLLNLPLTKEPTWLWETCNKWINDIDKIDSVQPYNNTLKMLLKKKDLSSEVKWLRSHLSDFHSPVVFCHNDMQEGNILMEAGEREKPSLIIIDYEYCGYNHRAFDIANHFIEWIFDYKVSNYPYFKVCPERYPSLQQQTLFVERYLAKTGSKESIIAVLEEVRNFTLASHMFWTLWGLLNGRISEIKFGYWEYATERLQMYYALKSQLINS